MIPVLFSEVSALRTHRPFRRWAFPWLPLTCVALLLAGCAGAGAPLGGGPRPAYVDGMEYFAHTRGDTDPRGSATAGMTYYFQTNARRICYSWEVPGRWQLGREAGVLRRLDEKGIVGVALFSRAELGASSVEDAIRKAAAQSDQIYAKWRDGAPSTLTPHPPIPGAWHWDVPIAETASDRPRIVPRWYLPVADAWIAQFSIGAPPEIDADTFVTDVIRSLTTSREPRCYERVLRAIGEVR